MTPKRLANAAIYYHDDGFDPQSKELNGRRIAGQSFLRGYVEHSKSDILCGAVDTPTQGKRFVDAAKALGHTGQINTRVLYKPGLAGNCTVLNMPGPNLAQQAWRRHHLGGSAFSICGITHTTATKRVMQGAFDVRCAPIEEWDGVICTSKAVHASVEHQFDLSDSYLQHRFGKAPVRPQTPIIPLGIHAKDFANDQAARKSWRDRLQIKDSDVAVLTMSRLNSFGKFDPLPMYQALEIAAQKTTAKVHYIAVGPYSDNVTKRVFENGAKVLAPSVTYHHVDGTKEPMMMGLWSAADIFTHPVDNIQETFGLAPVEAMAAGLPVVVSDWDGFKDTITPDAGYRIPTFGPKEGALRAEALRHMLDVDSYAQYMAQASFQTYIDVRAMAAAFAGLFNSPEKRAIMGAAGVIRANEIYDWKNIIPQYQEFWAELDRIREKALGPSFSYKPASMPNAPDPSELFASYPTSFADFEGRCFVAQSKDDANRLLSDLHKLRELRALNRSSGKTETHASVLKQIQRDSRVSFEALRAHLPEISDAQLQRSLIWLLKYNFIAIATD